MADSFDQIWREVRLYCPSAPAELVKRWLRDRFRHILEWKRWSWAMAEDQFTMPDAYSTGSIVLTQGSTTVTGNGTAWTSAMAGRQLKSKNFMWTILSVDVALQTLVIDKVWALPTDPTANYLILQALVTVPADFHAFETVKDPANNWRLWTNFSVRELDAIDPARSSTGNPTILASATYDPLQVNRIRYELWPHVTSARGFPYLYWKHPPDFDSTQTLPFTGELLKFGVLSDLCCWPGTPEQPNMMFNLNLSKKFDADFMDHLLREVRNDEEIYLSSFWYDIANIPYAPLDAKFYQTHAV